MSSSAPASGAGPAVGRLPLGALATAFLALCTGIVAMASFEFVVVPMQSELGFSTDNANALTFMPAAASLLVIFIAGALADRIGARRVMVAGAVLFAAGAVVVTIATGVSAVTLGRVLSGIGGSVMGIVGLAIINETCTEPRLRARVYGIFAATVPAMFFLIPPIAAIAVESSSWRVVTGAWTLLGLLTAFAAMRFASREGTGVRREMLTPVLAGIALAGISLGLINTSAGWQVALPLLALGLAGAVGLLAAVGRIEQPSMDLRWTRGPGVRILIIGMIAAAMPNLFFYTNLLLQYRYQVSMLLIAVLLMIPQAFAVAGGLLSGPISSRLGAARTAALALLVAGMTSLTGFAVGSNVPIWVPVAVLSISAFPVAASVGPLTEALLDQAPRELSGVASSMRNGFWTLGGCVGGAIFGSLAFSVFEMRLSQILDKTSITTEQAAVIAGQIRDGAIVSDLAARIPDAATRDLLVGQSSGLLEAQSYAYWTVNVLASAIYLLAAALTYAYVRRRSQA